MNTKCILNLFSLSFIAALSFMTAANAQGHLRIANENIRDKIHYNGTEHTVDTIKILFVNITKKGGKLYTLSPNEAFSYQTIPVATYGNVTASISFKEGNKISTFCLEDKENAIHVANGEKLRLTLNYGNNELTCTLTSSKKFGPSR